MSARALWRRGTEVVRGGLRRLMTPPPLPVLAGGAVCGKASPFQAPPEVWAWPDELTVLLRDFAPRESGGVVPVDGQRFRFGSTDLVTGAPEFWARCWRCDQEGPGAGTADAALAWVRVHPLEAGGEHSFQLLSTAPVRIESAQGR